MKLEDLDNDDKVREERLAELNEIAGVVKWNYVPFFGIPQGKWKIGAIWDRAYYDTAEYVIRGVVEGHLVRGYTEWLACSCSAISSSSS